MIKLAVKAIVLFFYCHSFIFACDINDAEWLSRSKYGLMVHYLPNAKLDSVVDSFDVSGFVQDVKDAGADYVIFTLGQNSGAYISPNSVYEKLINTEGKTPKRDLPMDLARSLTGAGLHFILYLPARAPQTVPYKNILGDSNEYEEAPQIFLDRWFDIIREWSLRYGCLVSGWWFDGVYNISAYEKNDNWRLWSEAVRLGNKNSYIAFNSGVNERSFSIISTFQNFTSGEQNHFEKFPAKNIANVTWHVVSYLGSSWGVGDQPRYSVDFLGNYIKKVNSLGGVVTVDVGVDIKNGRLNTEHLEFMREISSYVNK